VPPLVERRRRPRAGPLLRLYYSLKYSIFRRERRPRDGRRGLLMLQIDALAYADLRRALRLGYCPTIQRLLTEDDFRLRRWFCGLPAATPYCQAGIFHGENEGIPAFRFYDKRERRVITCNAPEGVQYIRDRIRAPGALAGGSSYVNLLDGDAATVAFTVATREHLSVYRRLGGTRMVLLMALHPIRLARMVLQAALEWLREEWERTTGELAGRATFTEGVFPFVRILSNVVVRELQTIAIMLDLYLGVPVIYSTFMQYDELAHHFGPTSRPALSDLKRTDARITEIVRMMRSAANRGYDLVILSDHGMTPSVSYRVRFGETLGTTVRRVLSNSIASFAEDSEYADVGPRLFGDWLRRHYGLRELLVPEKYRVDARHEVVVTYSSCLAELYFADDDEALDHDNIQRDPRRAGLYAALLAHPGIGLIATRDGGGVHLASRSGHARLDQGVLMILSGDDPLAPYGPDGLALRAIESLVRQHNGGDLVLFGAYDGYDIVSFDDQVGAHGSIGGDQVFPFLITPPSLGIDDATRIEDARDVHTVIMSRYASPVR
jgi:hypothetical protein